MRARFQSKIQDLNNKLEEAKRRQREVPLTSSHKHTCTHTHTRTSFRAYPSSSCDPYL
jgi:hypothetical protein